jgi:ATP/maltotriose-dependent transcriptional regulator MalT
MPHSDKSIVKDNFLFAGVTPVPVGSAFWFEWLSTAKNFSFKSQNGCFVAQCETRRNKGYWYAYRRRAGKLIKTYLGKTEELTPERLEQASLMLTRTALLRQFPNPPAGNETIGAEARIDTSFLPMAKVNSPVVPRQLVTRPRLIRKINTPLTLIYAPSGFGKSTLLNDWQQTCGHPVAWLSLDENDNDAIRFWHSVITALRTIDHDFGTELFSYLRASSLIRLPEFVSRLTNDIASLQATCPHFGLILDDFHRINQTEIYDSIQAWLEHLPSNMQLVILGHTKPPLSFGHLRAKGLLTELDANDLRFTLDEGIHYLRQYQQDTPIAYDDLTKLVRHTEGWAAGLTLTALALGKQGDHRQFIDTFSGAHIYLREYFMETVLQHSTPDVQAFLLKTAILKQLTGSLCDALTGRTDGEAILSRLWHENLFVVRLEEQGWYRYHDLFAEMLRSQLQARFPDEVPQLHQRAAQWYHEHYAPADTIYHLLATEAWEEAASLMEAMALRELEQYGEDSRLLRWLQELPESVVQQHKTLLFVYLRLAASALPRKKVENFIARIEANITHKSVARQTSDEQDVLIEIRRIRNIWSQGDTFMPPPTLGGGHDSRWELLGRLSLLTEVTSPNTEETDEQLAQLYEAAQAQRNLFVILMAGGSRARRMLIRGQLKRGEKIAQQVLQQATMQRGTLPEPASIPLAALGQIHFERNELDLAQKFLQRAVEVDPNPTSTNMTVQAAIQRAKIQSAQGKGDEARATLQAARELHARRPSGLWSDHDLIAYEAIFCLRAEDHVAAEQLLSQGSEPGTHTLSDLAYAEIALIRKQFESAEKLLHRLIAEYPLGLPFEPILGARSMLALALFGQHKINQARQVMADVIRWAAPERFIRPLLERGAPCIPLLTLVQQTENMTAEAQAFLKDLLRLFDHTQESFQISQTEIEALSTSASISPREQEVLRLISAGYSNAQLAQKLSISESTVKTHLSSIYRKLSVNSRVQAVTYAKELKLV